MLSPGQLPRKLRGIVSLLSRYGSQPRCKTCCNCRKTLRIRKMIVNGVEEISANDFELCNEHVRQFPLLLKYQVGRRDNQDAFHKAACLSSFRSRPATIVLPQHGHRPAGTNSRPSHEVSVDCIKLLILRNCFRFLGCTTSCLFEFFAAQSIKGELTRYFDTLVLIILNRLLTEDES